MEVVRKFVELADLKLSYLLAGSGNRTIICFHGHGKDAKDFLFLADKQNRIISVDLFLHGQSTFDKEKRIQKTPVNSGEVFYLINTILKNEKIERFDLLAYSQGGRFGLAILPMFIDRINNIYLVAIDGLNDNNIYSWTQRRRLGRRIFKYFAKNPRPLKKISSILVKLKIIHPKLHELLLHYTEDPQNFQRSFEAWASFRELRTNEKELSEKLKCFSGSFILLMGEYDHIITVKSAKNFLKRIHQQQALKIVSNGHDFFKPNSQKFIHELIDQN